MKVKCGALGSYEATDSNDTGVNIEQLEKVRVHVSGTFVGTWAVDISFDNGTTWAEFDTGTAADLTDELPPCSMVRGRCSAYTSGTIVMNYGGQNPDLND